MARSLLTYAFASDVVREMKIETLKKSLQRILFNHLLKGKIPLEGLEGFKNPGERS
jgi:hypothetical protein